MVTEGVAWSGKAAFEINMFGSCFVGGDGKVADGHGDLSLPSHGRKSRPPKSEGDGRIPNFWLKLFLFNYGYIFKNSQLLFFLYINRE